MTILAFWSVDSDIERHTLDNMLDSEAFEILFRRAMGGDEEFHFYDIESFSMDDAYGLRQHLLNGDDFQEDYNGEWLDGGHWCKVMHIPSDEVKRIMGIKEE